MADFRIKGFVLWDSISCFQEVRFLFLSHSGATDTKEVKANSALSPEAAE